MFIFALASNVYAEEHEGLAEDRVFVPFNFNATETLCAPTITGTFICEWNPNGNKNGTIYNPVTVEEESDNTTKEPLVCPDRFILNETEDDCLPVKPIVVVDTPVQERSLTKFEADKEYYENNPPTTLAEKEYFELVKELGSCQRGTGSATGIQQMDRFVVSTTWINPDEAYINSIDLTGPHSVLRKAIEECKAQHGYLEPNVFGRQYVDRVNAERDNPYYEHSKRPTVLELGAFPQINLNPHSYIETLEDAENTLCNHTLYGYDTKESYGCYNENKVNVGGVVETVSSPIHKFNEYKTRDWSTNTSVIVKNVGSNPVTGFIHANGGYQEAIDAINWQKHFDSNKPSEMVKNWNE